MTKAPLPIKDGGDDDDPEEVGDEGDAPYESSEGVWIKDRGTTAIPTRGRADEIPTISHGNTNHTNPQNKK